MKTKFLSYYNKPAAVEGSIGAAKIPAGKPNEDKIIFIYELLGTPEEIAQYKLDREAAGNKFSLSDNGHPMYFTTKALPAGVHLKRSINGKWYPDNSKILIAKSLAKQFGGSSTAFDTVFAQTLVQEALANAPAPEPEPEIHKQDELDLDPGKI